MQRPFCTAVVLAAGSSKRMEGENKQLLTIAGKPLIVYSLEAMQSCPEVDEIIVVSRHEDIIAIGELCKDYGISKVKKIVCGGEERYISAYIGVSEASKHARIIAIHDGARPFVTPELITKTVNRAVDCKAAAPAVSVTDTIKEITKDGRVLKTPDRTTLKAVQTPQVFDADLIKAALKDVAVKHADITDDLSAVERLGVFAELIDGDPENIKITTPTDVYIAEAILVRRSEI